MGWGDRERSPHRGDKQRKHWISKQIALLGRYGQNRPAGLEVDNQGCIKLQNLSDTWGYEQSVSKEEIVQAVEENLMNTRTGGARFKMHYDARVGDTIIQVHRAGGEFGPKNGTTQWTSCSWKSDKTWNDSAQVKQETSWKPKEEKSWKWADNSYKANNTAYRDSWTKEEPKTETWNRGNAAGWRFQGSQGGTSSQGWKSNKGGGHTQEKTEQIQRYMGFLLKGGKEDCVYKDWEGYAPLADMVTAMQTRKPDFGIDSVEALKAFLQETDHEGRFSIKDDRVRKTDHNERHGSSEWKGATNSHAPAPEERRPSQFNAFTPNAYASKKEEADYGDNDDGNQATPGVADVKVKQEHGPPKKPPGKHWVQYDDNTTIWWYYDGPKGVWWMGPEHQEPQPYNSAAPADDGE